MRTARSARLAGLRVALILLAVAVLAFVLVSDPVDFAVFMGVIAVYCGIGALRMQRRMRAPFATTALGLAALDATVVVYLLSVHGLEPSSPATLVAMIAGTVVCLGLFAVEAYVHPQEWDAWKARLAEASVLDILLARTIPRTVDDPVTA